MMTYSAPGKLLLFGEHAAVYGFPAVGVSLPLSLTIRCTPADGFSVVLPHQAVSETSVPGTSAGTAPATTPETTSGTAPLTAAGTELPPEQARAFYAHLARIVGETPGATLPRERCEIVSELPVGGGFGSSAALCTALARRVLPAGTDRDTVWLLAHRFEHFFHGTPSGIDTGLSCREGAWAFRFPSHGTGPFAGNAGASAVNPGGLPRVEVVTLPPMVLVVGSVPRESSTKDLVRGVGARYRSDPGRYGAILGRLGELSDQTARDISGERSSFAARVNQAQEQLRALGVSSPLLDELIARGRDAGASAGKLSGAGGGGAFFLVCADAACAETVRTAVAEHDTAPAALFAVELGGSVRS
jgi:mevalonate kinase